MTYFPSKNLTTKSIEAKELFDAATLCGTSLKLKDGTDATDLLRLFGGGLLPTTETLTGKSIAGIHFTFGRIGRLMAEGDQERNEQGDLKGISPVNPYWNWVRLGDLKAFGLKRAVWVPGYQSDDRIIYEPRALFNPDWEYVARYMYDMSDSCRSEDFDFHLGQLRGIYLGFNLAGYLEANEINKSIRYQRKWLTEFKTDRDIAEVRLLSELELSGVFDLA